MEPVRPKVPLTYTVFTEDLLPCKHIPHVAIPGRVSHFLYREDVVPPILPSVLVTRGWFAYRAPSDKCSVFADIGKRPEQNWLYVPYFSTCRWNGMEYFTNILPCSRF